MKQASVSSICHDGGKRRAEGMGVTGHDGVLEHCHFIDSQDQADVFNARLRAQVVRSFAEGGNISNSHTPTMKELALWLSRISSVSFA